MSTASRPRIPRSEPRALGAAALSWFSAFTLWATPLPAAAKGEPITCEQYLSLNEKTRRGLTGTFLWAYLTSRSASDLNPTQAGSAIASVGLLRAALDKSCKEEVAGDLAVKNAAAVIALTVQELRASGGR